MTNPEPPLPYSPAAERNRGPILDVLKRWLPAQATVLELASGTGQHAAHCAAACSGWHWQPTEAEPAALPAIAAWCRGLGNVAPPVALDVLTGPWPAAPAVNRPWSAIYCANLIHIAPWSVTVALMQGAAQALPLGAALILYGPYRVDGEPLAPGNQAFDTDLRSRNPAWGLRRLADVEAAANAAGLQLEERADMPANNLMLCWRRV